MVFAFARVPLPRIATTSASFTRGPMRVLINSLNRQVCVAALSKSYSPTSLPELARMTMRIPSVVQTASSNSQTLIFLSLSGYRPLLPPTDRQPHGRAYSRNVLAYDHCARLDPAPRVLTPDAHFANSFRTSLSSRIIFSVSAFWRASWGAGGSQPVFTVWIFGWIECLAIPCPVTHPPSSRAASPARAAGRA